MTKMIKEGIPLHGQVKIVLRGPDGKIKERIVKNTVVTVGKNHIANLLAGGGDALIGNMRLGGDGTPVQLTDTALISEVAGSNVSVTPVQGVGANANKVTYAGSWGVGVPAGTNAIEEAGLFNNTSGGIMLARTVFPTKTKGENDTMTITWEITIGPV